jgi:muconate cycloisomerase
LGGKLLDKVPCDYWMGRGTAERTAERVQRGVDLGFTGFKMKCRPDDPSSPAQRVAAARQIAADIPLVLDFNESLPTPADAVAVGRSLDPFSNVILESPVRQDRLDWYVLLREKVKASIALHLTSLTQLLPALRLDASDYYNLLGPLREFTEWAKLTRAAGCPTWRGSGGDLGIRDMSSVHCAAAAGCELHCDITGATFLREDDLIVTPIEYDHGSAIVPDAPGLGVELDREALEKYRCDD